LILVVVGCKGKYQKRVIISLPAYGNNITRALGISNLKISTTISTTGVSICGWRYGGEFDGGSFYSGFGCRNYTGVNETITCVNNAGIVTSHLTLLQPQYKDLNVNMQCSPSPSYSVNIVFKACPTGKISPGLIMSKQSTSPCGYGCTARFSCAAGYTGNTVDATCNEQATWSPAPNCSLGKLVTSITVVDNTMSDPISKDCNSDAVIVGSCLAVVILIFATIAL
uniref:Sushi domain-containing protein n=1 Tax=Ciona intestinalis TaxID=7719 RepID=H2XM73_CIOIN